MTKLSDTQLIVLSAAAARDDKSILPLPGSIRGGAATKVIDGLIRRGLAERIASKRAALPELIRITRAGFEAIGVEPEDEAPADGTAQAEAEPPAKGKRRRKEASTTRADGERTTRAGTKQALLIELLMRPEGATIAQLAETTGWQYHTVRGAISGTLKKRLGLTIISEKTKGAERVYRITGAAQEQISGS